ncbi:hypothetical protein FH972_022517 [Carpinus fangiana]|uniref:Cyclase n=1 Tax=Carpinus fangiana TaxID=176857 RepID=A0A5N6KST3_9ROSI|nr:hypothetical protein FH972_022517 [Carpinus fangiana]
MANPKTLDFDSLPPVKSMPHGCAWGLWDKNGVRDSNGTLNLLTPDVVLAAKAELTEGTSCALNWPMHNIAHPGFGREPLEHKFKHLGPHFEAYDDIVSVNTQAGSQWDGFKHWAHQESGLYYNNLKSQDVPKTTDNGIHHWSERGGIVGRGVLLDYVAYAERKGIKYDPWTRHEISVDDLKQIVKDEKLELRVGDILIIRSGFVRRYNEANEEERIKGVNQGHAFVGVNGSEELMKWLWNNHFSAIAGDTIAWEAWPPQAPWIVHDFSLALWGEPIGELWDLEKLAHMCAERKRWSFFFTSAPINVHGGVASPPNALAIF